MWNPVLWSDHLIMRRNIFNLRGPLIIHFFQKTKKMNELQEGGALKKCLVTIFSERASLQG